MIIALPSMAAARCTRLPSAHALGTKALWPGGDASQAILFFVATLCSRPCLKIQRHPSGGRFPRKIPLEIPPGIPMACQFFRRGIPLSGLPAIARLHAVVEWKHHCGSGGTGRRARLRILWPKGRGGSNPSFRTNLSDEERLSRANIVSRGTLPDENIFLRANPSASSG